MSGPQSPQRRAGRSQPLGGGDGDGGLNSGFINGAQLFGEWRQDVNDQLDNTARILQQVQLGMERMNQNWAEHDRRIGALEDRPREAREARLGERNLTAQLWLVGCGLLTVLAYLLPHLSFH